MACAGFLCFAKVLRNKRLFHLINKAFLFRNSLTNKCWLVLFYTPHRLTVTSCHHRNLTSAGLPAGRAFARKYHYHRYLLSLSASSKLAAVPKNNTCVSFRVSVACRFPYDNGKVSAQGYLIVMLL